MFVTPEQITAANKASVETLLTVANTALASAERLATLNLTTARAVLDEAVANTRAVLGAKDVQEVVALQSALAQPGFERAVSYSKSVYELSSKTQEELAKVIEGQLTEVNKTTTVLLEKAAKNAPAGSDVAVAAVKSALAAANSAFEGLNKAAKQVAEITEANVAAATNATVKAVGATASAAKVASAKKAA